MEGMCCVDGCDRKENFDKSVLFHKFPKNKALKRCWLDSIPMKKDIPGTLLVCSDHFIETDYKHVRGKKILNLDNIPTVFTKIAKDPDKCNEDILIQLDNEASLKRKSKKKVGNSPKLSKDRDKNDAKLIESDDEAPLKRKTEEHVDKPLNMKLSKNLDKNNCEQIEAEEETNLKSQTKKEVDKNGDAKLIHSDDEVPLTRKSKEHVEKTSTTKISKDPDKNYYKQKEVKLKRKTRKRVSKVNKNKCKNRSDDLKPSDSVKVVKSDNDNKNNDISIVNNQINSNDYRITNEVTRERINIEVKTADFHDFDQKLDLEDNIPSFIIKDNKPRQLVEITVPPCDDEVPQQTTEVVNIEVSVDPTLLMMDEPSVVEEIELSDDSDIEITGIEKKCLPTDPVSLLTSSDEDEVIYLEPKYDTVDVSDETDEEDRPLIRFINKKLKETSNYLCSMCDFSTDIHGKYVKHLRKHTIFMCTMCGQALKGKSQLNYHMRKHGLEKKYKCHLCSYKAKYQMSLILHVSTHKTYLRCKTCPFVTWDRNILSQHSETHLLNRC